MTQPIIPRINGLSSDQVLTLVYCRTLPQYCHMMEKYLAGVCIFCDPLDSDVNELVHECGDWRMWLNPFPHAHTSLHLVMAPRQHITSGKDLHPGDFASMGVLFAWACSTYRLTGGGFAMRFGSPFESACTVLHQHANIIVPDRTGAVNISLNKSPATLSAQIQRMYVFEKLRNGAELARLRPDEQQLVEGRV